MIYIKMKIWEREEQTEFKSPNVEIKFLWSSNHQLEVMSMY